MLIGSVLLSFIISSTMLLISSQNYPGGEAMLRLHTILSPALVDQAGTSPSIAEPISVHLDNLVCQTGATRFLEVHTLDSNGSRIVTYDKSDEEELLLTPQFWRQFDYVLAERPERVIGKWEILDTVQAYTGIKMLRRGEESRLSQIKRESGGWGLITKGHNLLESLLRERALGGRWIEVKIEPRVNVLKRQPGV
jgi:alpha-1,6-mannosyltransferase